MSTITITIRNVPATTRDELTARAATQASLPMYDFPELAQAHDQLWTKVRDRLGDLGIDAPERLTRTDDVHALWHAPELFLSQACGGPLIAELDGRVRTLGAFRYRIPSAVGACYRSQIVTREQGPNLAAASLGTAAVNSFDSLSGWTSLIRTFPSFGGRWPGRTIVTGSHAASLARLQEGSADIASIDGVTWALLRRMRPALVDGLLVAAEGPLVPCLPLIAHPSMADEVVAGVRDALMWATTTTDDRSHLDQLLIEGFVPLDLADYSAVRDLAVSRPGG